MLLHYSKQFFLLCSTRDITVIYIKYCRFSIFIEKHFTSLMIIRLKKIKSELGGVQKHDVVLCVWLSERTYANLLSLLQLTSQLYYHIAVINIWLTYLSNGIHLSFFMPCDYIFIAFTYFTLHLLSFSYFLLLLSLSFFITPPPIMFCLSLSSPPAT